ncbi:MAG TPA: DUF4388 domain-containing protein [Planktothrix sp.]|jgi:hypothetical protein
MLQNRQDKRHIQLPRQARPPSSHDIDHLFGQATANANIGRVVELPFGSEPVMFMITVTLPKLREKAQWMFYKVDHGQSSLEWSETTSDTTMIHNALCAQFPEVDMDLKSGKGLGMGAPPLILQQGIGEPAGGKAPRQSQQSMQQYRPQAPSRGPGKSLMEGELKHLSAANLMQSIQVGKMTGRLEVIGQNDTINVFFADGTPVHALAGGAEGEGALVELVSLTSGAYKFYHEAPPNKRTINKRLDTLLLEGATLTDHCRWLDGKGVNAESYLTRLHGNITEQSFEQIVSKGLPCDLGLQKSLYQAIDNHSTLMELLRRLPLRKFEWVPALHNMINCQLVGIRNGPPPTQVGVQQESKNVSPTKIDWLAVRAAERSLYRSDSGLLLFPAFLGFIEREHQRAQALRRPYAIVILELMSRNDETNERVPLSIKGVKDVAQHIEGLKRKCDIMGHYETFSLALLLPETSSASARTFARTLCDVLISRGLQEEGRHIVMKMGVGSVPDDCDRLESLLTVAHPR